MAYGALELAGGLATQQIVVNNIGGFSGGTIVLPVTVADAVAGRIVDGVGRVCCAAGGGIVAVLEEKDGGELAAFA